MYKKLADICRYELPTNVLNFMQKDSTEVKIFQKVLGLLLFLKHLVRLPSQPKLVLITPTHRGIARLNLPGGWLQTKIAYPPKDGHLACSKLCLSWRYGGKMHLISRICDIIYKVDFLNVILLNCL